MIIIKNVSFMKIKTPLYQTLYNSRSQFYWINRIIIPNVLFDLFEKDL